MLALKPADAQAFYARTYRPDLTTIVVVGDVTPADARAAVQRAFGGWTAAGPTPRDRPAADPAERPREGLRARPQQRCRSTVDLAEALAARVDDPDHFTLTVGNEILGSGFSSRLYQDLRVKGGYVYSVSSALRWSRTRSDYSVTFGADPDKIGRGARPGGARHRGRCSATW